MATRAIRLEAITIRSEVIYTTAVSSKGAWHKSSVSPQSRRGLDDLHKMRLDLS